MPSSFSKSSIQTPVSVPNGGTGQTTLTNHGVLLGQAGGAIAATSAGTSGYVLTSNGAGADPTFQAATGGGDMVLADIQTVTGAKTFNDGKLLLAGSTSGAATLKAPAVASTYVHTLPAATTTLVGTDFAQTLTNKTLTSPIIANIAPGADFTLTQNSVVPFTSVNAAAVANTLVLKTGLVGITTATPYSGGGNVLDLGVGKMTGGTYSATYRVLLDMSASAGFPSANFIFPASGKFLAGEVSIKGTNDIFFQGYPVGSSGYTFLEAWASAGMAIGTGGNSNPIFLQINRNEIARITAAGLSILTLGAPTAYLHIAAGTAAANTAPIKLTTGVVNTTAVAGQIEYTTPTLYFTNGGAQRQEIPQIQQSYVAAQFDKASNTTLSAVTGLTATLVAGKKYRFEAELFVDADATGGSKFTMNGTATATSVIYEIQLLDNTTSANTITSRQTTLGGSAGQASTTSGFCRISGIIVCNAAGTLIPYFAQNAASGTSSILVGSTFQTQEIA
jgi:hypothetical protein